MNRATEQKQLQQQEQQTDKQNRQTASKRGYATGGHPGKSGIALTTINERAKLTPPMLTMLELLADPLDRRTKYQKATCAGINEATLYDWQKLIPIWHSEIGRLTREKTEKAYPSVMRSVVQKAVKGDMRAAELYLKVTGRMPSQTAVNVAVDARKQEIVAAEIPLDELLLALSDDGRRALPAGEEDNVA